MKKKNILFVCLANICRSPALMATFNHLAALKKLDVHADSCGMGWTHLGQRPSMKTFEAAKKRGILIDHRAEEFQDSFFEIYDLILPVNDEIAEQLKQRGPKFAHKIKLATEYSEKYKAQPIADPYYLSENGFDEVLDIIEDACKGLIKRLSQ